KRAWATAVHPQPRGAAETDGGGRGVVRGVSYHTSASLPNGSPRTELGAEGSQGLLPPGLARCAVDLRQQARDARGCRFTRGRVRGTGRFIPADRGTGHPAARNCGEEHHVPATRPDAAEAGSRWVHGLAVLPACTGAFW